MRQLSRIPLALWAVPALALALTAFAWHAATTATAARAEERFLFRADVIESGIRERMRNYEDILRGVAGLFESSDSVTREEWHEYMRSIRPDVFEGGLQALGIAVRIQPSGLRSFEGVAHGKRIPFRVWPSGFRDEYYPIVFVHPFDGANKLSLGYDVATEATRRRAMIRAADEGRPVLSGRVRLAQEEALGEPQPGFLLYSPLYRHGMPTSTVEERRAALRGVVFAAFRARDLMDRVFGGHHWDVNFEIYDGERDRDEALMYRSGGQRLAGLTPGPDVLMHRSVVRVSGHPWLLVVAPSRTLLSDADRYQPWLIAGGGVAVSLMFALGLWSSATVRRRALVLAEQMASAFRVNEAKTRVMVDSITDHAIFTLDVQRRVTSWNMGSERMLGFTEAEILGQPVSAFLPEVDRDYDIERIHASPTGRHFREGWHIRKHGDQFWGVLAIAPLQSEGMGDRGYVVILRDDTDRKQAMEALAQTSAALEQRTVELGRFNRLAFGRELRMVELKRMVNERSVQLGIAPPFDLSFAEGFEDVVSSEDAA